MLDWDYTRDDGCKQLVDVMSVDNRYASRKRPAKRESLNLAERAGKQRLVATQGTLTAFFKLLDEDTIQDMLWFDRNCRLADKYLLAMVYVYFKRAGFLPGEYTQRKFFVAMYLAVEMEEDDDNIKRDLLPWALGRPWSIQYRDFLDERYALWRTIHYRAAVSCTTCHEVMSLAPYHPVWLRSRDRLHAGATRHYVKIKSKTLSRTYSGLSSRRAKEE
ncbi:speedy protein A-like isoform X2 [Corticium candelabrum]|uniref:speedy protein A-like isoform X2 n=1 Tax=Corticium candelabrum TaxID=121492 RepID=UPI002E25EBE0|nr:speedy protein A-like isoform X2 [Corticium candelabrum]